MISTEYPNPRFIEDHATRRRAIRSITCTPMVTVVHVVEWLPSGEWCEFKDFEWGANELPEINVICWAESRAQTGL